jgi:16S rRNA (adenine1518-N6/adenine1519-N6)-dimethyltransferase
MLLTPEQYFRLQGRKPRKRFGQHFLSQSGTAEKIVASADLDQNDVAVEVGPGLGALTRHILHRVNRLHLVELDRDLAGYLKENLEPGNCRVEVHQQDVMTFDFSSLSRREGRRMVLLGNLPYNISSPLLFHILSSGPAVERAVFMVQREVGERIAAEAGGKDYGVLSVLLGICSTVRPLFTVDPSQFYPPPRVDSLVVRIDFPDEPPAVGLFFDFLRRLVSVSFQKRRKTLQNSLKGSGWFQAEVLDEAFRACGIDPRRRPETLRPEEFLKLAEFLYRRGKR